MAGHAGGSPGPVSSLALGGAGQARKGHLNPPVLILPTQRRCERLDCTQPLAAKARSLGDPRAAQAPTRSLLGRKSRLRPLRPSPIGPCTGVSPRVGRPPAGASAGRCEPLKGHPLETRRNSGLSVGGGAGGAGQGAPGRRAGLPPRDPEEAAPSLVGVVVRPWLGGPAAHARCTEACFTSVTTGELGFLFSPFVPP